MSECVSEYVKTYLKLFKIVWNGSNRFKHVQISLTFSLVLQEGQISEAETLKLKLEQTQRECRLEMKEYGTKHTPIVLSKKTIKVHWALFLSYFLTSPFGVCLVSDSSISNWNSFCNFTNFNLSLSALDMKLNSFDYKRLRLKRLKICQNMSNNVRPHLKLFK